MDINTLIAGIDFSRSRLLGILSTIENSGQDVQKVLAWRPAPGRAHIGWQAMHLAATHHRYVNIFLLGREVTDPELTKNFGGGSKVSDDNVPTLAAIRSALETNLAVFRNLVLAMSAEDLARTHTTPNGVTRSAAEAILLLTWHEAHHQGQIHITWNMYKAAHGIG